MKTKRIIKKDDNAEDDTFLKTASHRHINLDDMQKLAYLIYESVYGTKIRKINRNRQKLKPANTSKTLANSAE